jgi:uncharacterized protein involved in outer membrane biogenesis
LVLRVLLVDWTGLDEPIARRISNAIGKSVAVNGDLSVRLSWPPRIVANKVVFGNAAWSPDPAMTEIKRLEFAIDLFKLLIGRVEFPEEMISADLVAKQLPMKDLGGFIGVERGTQPSGTPPLRDKVLPAEPFTLEKLNAANADVHFRGDKILAGNMLLNKMNGQITVNNGVLTLAPLDFGIAGGHLVSLIEMDGRHQPIAIRVDTTAKGLHLDQLFPTVRLADSNTGTMGGRARLAGHGNSVAQMLASATGEAALIMDGGSVGELVLRLSNLDMANSLLVMLGGDRQVPIRCMVGNFNAIDVVFSVQDLVLDTPKVNITGSGNVDFTDESLHLRLVPQSKGFSLIKQAKSDARVKSSDIAPRAGKR